nr:ATP-binding protein [Thalassotalea sp. G2M2-11]
MFISLYLVVITGILSINWASELLWSTLDHSPSRELSTSMALTSSLAQLVNNSEQLTNINPTPFKLKLIELSDIAWLPAQKAALQRGDVLPLYDLEQQLYLYAITANKAQLLQVGPISQATSFSGTKLIVQTISYLLLALIIALWTRPVWRDLKQLTSLANNIHSLQKISNKPITSHSPITNVVSAMNKMALRIKHLIQEQKQLVNAVSHELRTPLSRLRFSIAMLKNIAPEQQQGIEQDLQEIESLVDEMLSYSRIEHIALQQNRAQTNISELLQHQVEKHRTHHQVNIITDIAKNLWLYSNGELIERACQNLIINALRYANQQIKVSATQTKDQLKITVEDDGAGIEKAYWPTIFDPFSRVEQSRNKSHGGYGLGLAIVKKASEWHHGNCQVSDSPLGGACFTISLPTTIQAPQTN